MMKKKTKVLSVIGSPRGKFGNTHVLTQAFIKGMGDIELRELPVYQSNIQHCRGCQYCLMKNPGHCTITDDDMLTIRKELRWPDIIIWSMPLYFYGMPSKVKALFDRTMPESFLAMHIDADGNPDHVPMEERGAPKNILLSTCGFPIVEHNYEALLLQCQIIFKREYAGAITMPEGALLTNPKSKADERVLAYLAKVKEAGAEFMADGLLTEKTQKELSKPVIPPEEYIKRANSLADTLKK